MDQLKNFGIDLSHGRHYEEIMYGIALVYNRMNTEANNFFKHYDLNVSKFNILMVVKHHGGSEGICQVDISKHLIVTPSNMTKMLDKLEKEELVTRSALKGDRRVNIIKITKKGRTLLDTVWPDYLKTMKKLASPLNAGQQKQLSSLLTGWFAHLRPKE